MAWYLLSNHGLLTLGPATRGSSSAGMSIVRIAGFGAERTRFTRIVRPTCGGNWEALLTGGLRLTLSLFSRVCRQLG